MNNVMTWCLSILLVTAAVAAQINLARHFLADWLAGRRESPRRQLRQRRARRKTTRSHRHATAGLVTAAMVVQLPGLAAAQDATGNAVPVADAKNDELGTAISVQLNLDYTTAYFYRGIIQEDSGLILQPAARMTVNLHEGDAFKLDGFSGVWNSFHGQQTGAQTHGDFTEYWYEADLYGGITLSLGKIALSTSYTFLTSPSDAYETVQELGFTLAYDDSEWLGEWSLKPYAMVAIETGADASDGADSGTGSYLELGIAPGFTCDIGKTPVTLTVPASVGLSLSDYYEDAGGNDDTFGFAQVGAKASIPLGEPGRLGAWTLNAGVSVLLLGDHTEGYNGGDATEVIGTIGLQVNF
jgi:hypothetical protein